jgi:hypothetical protein
MTTGVTPGADLLRPVATLASRTTAKPTVSSTQSFAALLTVTLAVLRCTLALALTARLARV